MYEPLEASSVSLDDVFKNSEGDIGMNILTQ